MFGNFGSDLAGFTRGLADFEGFGNVSKDAEQLTSKTVPNLAVFVKASKKGKLRASNGRARSSAVERQASNGRAGRATAF